jgi:hypothetical protein
MDRTALGIAGVFAGVMLLAPTAARSQAAAHPSSQIPLRAESGLHLAQSLAQSFAQGCSRRIGPFVTQDTAWRRWREARGQGYSVSAGVFPCYDGGTRGYCFNILYPC